MAILAGLVETIIVHGYQFNVMLVDTKLKLRIDVFIVAELVEVRRSQALPGM